MLHMLEKFFLSIQKYLGVDLSYLIRGSFWLTISRIFSIGSSLLLALIVANYVPPEIYGQYKYITGILAFLTMFSLLGMGEAITLAVARGHEGDVIPSLLTKMKWSLLGSVTSAAIAGYYYMAGNNVLGTLFLLCSLGLPFFQTAQVFTGLLIGKKLFKDLTIIQTAASIITTITIGFAFYLTDNIIVIFSTFLTSYIATSWLSAWYIIKKHKPNTQRQKGTISFGKHLSVIRLASHVSNNLDGILVWHFAGAASLAMYSFATAIPNELFGTIKGFQTLATPKFAAAETGVVKKTLPKKAFRLFFIVLILVVSYILVAPFIFEIFFPQYIDAVIYTQFFSLSYLFMPKNFFYQFLCTRQDVRTLHFIAYSTQAVQLLSLLVLGFFFQIFGIIASKLVMHVYNTVVVLYFFKKL